MFGGARILLVIGVCTVAMPALAQAPAPTTTALEGKYVGTATNTGGGRAPHRCGNTVISMDMTIAGRQVVIHETMFNGDRRIYRGSVNLAGEVLTVSEQEQSSTYIMVSGAIRDKVFAGDRLSGHKCYYRVQMQMVPR
jgi:hypothetical protein